MKRNYPVTNNEQLFSDTTNLISATDLQGRITYCNAEFEEVSGYSKEELIGQSHNLVRHPDMPSLAFKAMWERLKSGRSWMGLVKNRCKNGDYYWVDAYVTPIHEGGKIVGYESVRSCPKREDVRRAEELYHSMSQGKTGGSEMPFAGEWIVLLLILLFCISLFSGGFVASSLAMLSITAICMLGWSQYKRDLELKKFISLRPNAFIHPVAVKTYTNKMGVAGQLHVAILSEIAHLRTVLIRIKDAAAIVARNAEEGVKVSEGASSMMHRQQIETDQVAAAMHEMHCTINDVSEHVQETSTRANQSSLIAKKGREVSKGTRVSVGQLRNTVVSISESVRKLSEESEQINHAAKLIEQIADQTNLLALNAAIEAARAGNHGRGFAVVADEVRQLALRTQSSTREIYDILDSLSKQTARSVEVANAGKKEAEVGLDQVVKTESILGEITEIMDVVANMSVQMAAAVEEQAQVSEDINQQVVSIHNLSADSLSAAEVTADKISILQTVAEDLDSLVIGFGAER